MISNVGIHKHNKLDFVFLVQHAINELKMENQLELRFAYEAWID